MRKVIAAAASARAGRRASAPLWGGQRRDHHACAALSNFTHVVFKAAGWTNLDLQAAERRRDALAAGVAGLGRRDRVRISPPHELRDVILTSSRPPWSSGPTAKTMPGRCSGRGSAAAAGGLEHSKAPGPRRRAVRRPRHHPAAGRRAPPTASRRTPAAVGWWAPPNATRSTPAAAGWRAPPAATHRTPAASLRHGLVQGYCSAQGGGRRRLLRAGRQLQ